MTAAVDCNLFRRADSRTTGDMYGVGVGQWTGGKVNAQNVTVRLNLTFGDVLNQFGYFDPIPIAFSGGAGHTRLSGS